MRKLLFILLTLVVARAAAAQPPSPALILKGLDGHTVQLSGADFQNSVHVQATDHDGKQHDFEGISVRALLSKLGVPTGGALRGKELTDVLVAEASDGYRVIFSIAELDPDFGNTQVFVVTRMDGQPLNAHDGPLRLVVPGDKHRSRWARMVASLTVTRVP